MLFAGRYLLGRKLGSGGMADVWLAEDKELGRRVAVKILHERYASDEQFVERFRREATNAAGLSHPNIVSIYDRGEADGSYFIVMEYVEGRTLKELVVTRGPCPIPVAISYTRQVLAALRYAHRHAIIHRDIKPHNVIVDHEGRVKVADFGIARAGASQITEAGSIIGTAQYLSPEQARGAPVDESSDLYSTGVVLYELLTGTVAFTGETPVEIAMKHISQTPEAPSVKRPEIPHDLDLVVLRALAKEPADRYRSAQEMDRDLELVARGESVARETEEAATVVLAGATAITEIGGPAKRSTGGYGGDERYRAYDGPVSRGRGIWPWLLIVGAVIALGVTGWFLYDRVQEQIDSNAPVSVNDYRGIQESLAVENIANDGFEPRVTREPNEEVAGGIHLRPAARPGDEARKGEPRDRARLDGQARGAGADVVGKTEADAVAEITRAGLDANSVQINSSQPAGIVTGQAPPPGTTLVEGSEVRINVSKGPKPVGVPSVVGLLFETAAAQLQAAEFAVARTDVDSDEPRGTVVSQNPAGNSTAALRSTVTLSVSKGPTTIEVPDVTGLDVASARQTLRAAGFRVTLTTSDTEDESLDGLVASQSPLGQTQAEADSTVAIEVWRYVPPPVTTDTTTETDTTGDAVTP